MSTIEFRELGRSEPPIELLLRADPSTDRIDAYLKSGKCYLAFTGDRLLGVMVLVETSPGVIELANIAVTPEARGKGIGQALVQEAKRLSRTWGGRLLEVGTGNSSIDQLAFYQKCGFRMVGIERDFFTRNYEQEIIENGIKCVDRVRLSMDLNV
jgi:GNAT superfamily N-acetyltransferase